MTFSLIARDRATGRFGIVVTSSSPAVGARCAHARAGVGVVASQNVTNPGLGPAALDAMARGDRAESALATALASDRFPEFRQVTVVDAAGGTAVHSGERALGVHGVVRRDHAVAAGNLLAGDHVLAAVMDGYTTSDSAAFEARLLDGLRAGHGAGGEAGPLRSAALLVVEDVPWALTDLRVDDDDDPVGRLTELWRLWQPHKYDYRTRAIDPTSAPTFGVPGDL